MDTDSIYLDVGDISTIAKRIALAREKVEVSTAMLMLDFDIPHFAYQFWDGGQDQMNYLFPETLIEKEGGFGKETVYRTTVEALAYSIGIILGNLGYTISEQDTVILKRNSYEELRKTFFEDDDLPIIKLKLGTPMIDIDVSSDADFAACYSGHVEINRFDSIAIALLRPAKSGAIFFFKHYSY